VGFCHGGMVGWLLWVCTVGYVVVCTGFLGGGNWADFVETGVQSHEKGCIRELGYLVGQWRAVQKVS